MFNSNNIAVHDEYRLLAVTPAGFLRIIYCPFQVRCIIPVGFIKSNTLVNVDAVYNSDEHKLLYKVLNQRVPYHHFLLIIT